MVEHIGRTHWSNALVERIGRTQRDSKDLTRHTEGYLTEKCRSKDLFLRY